MTTTYTILASITLQHDYYVDGRCMDFDIVPTPATAKVLSGLGILSKMVENSLILLIKLNDSGEVRVVPPVDLKLGFYLQLNNTSFSNFTNAPYASDSFLYFSNLTTTQVDGTLYLNQSVADYTNTSSYQIADMVRDPLGDVYEAIKPSSAGAHDTGDPEFWSKRSARQYVNPLDEILLSDGNLPLPVTPAKNFAISVFSLNPFTLIYDIPLDGIAPLQFQQAMDSIVVNLQDIPNGRYRLVVNGEERFIYKDQMASYSRAYGVIEIFNVFSAANTFGLLDAANKPKGLDLVIRFANRLAIWKYITRISSVVTGIEIPAVPNAFNLVPGSSPQQFVSAAPMLMREQALKTVQLMKDATILASKLANPPPDRISRFTDTDGNSYYCAEMYLNY